MRRKTFALTSVLLPALTCAVAAQGSGNADPGRLPAYHGQVQLFTLTPRGDIDGLVLTDGTEVKTPPHLSTEIALVLRPGDAVTIHGLKAAKLPLIEAMSVTNDRDGRSVDTEAEGRLARRDSSAPANRPILGRVRMPLHGPRGEVNGILLEDGTILKLPPPDVDRFVALLAPGRAIAAEGTIRSTLAGTVVEVTSLGASPDQLQPVE